MSRPDGRGHRPDGRDRPRVPARAGRARDVGRILGMARRPFDPPSSALSKTEYRQGDVLDRDAVDALAARGRRARPPRVHHPRRPRGDARGSTSTGSRNVFARRGAAREAARLHVVGRRLRLPRRQPAAADRGRAAARQRALLLLGPEGRARAALDEEIAGADVEAYVLRPCIVAGPDAPAAAAPAPADRLPGRRSRAARPGHAVPARPPRRRRDARSSPRRSAAARRAPTTSPARGRSRSAISRARSAGSRPRPAPAARPGVARRRACRSCRASRSGSTPAACRWSWTRARPERDWAGGRATARARRWTR